MGSGLHLVILPKIPSDMTRQIVSVSTQTLVFSPMSVTPKKPIKMKKKRGPRGPYKKRKKKKLITMYQSGLQTAGRNPCRFYKIPYDQIVRRSPKSFHRGSFYGMEPPVYNLIPGMPTDPVKHEPRCPMRPAADIPPRVLPGFMPPVSQPGSFGNPTLPTLLFSDLETLFGPRLSSPRVSVHVTCSPGALVSKNLGIPEIPCALMSKRTSARG